MSNTWRSALIVFGGAVVVALILNLPVFSRVQPGAVFSVKLPTFNTGVSLVCRGDVDCNGVVNAADLNLFSGLLINPEEYQTQHPACPRLNADINNDGQVNNFDIEPFQLLVANRRSTTCISDTEARSPQPTSRTRVSVKNKTVTRTNVITGVGRVEVKNNQNPDSLLATGISILAKKGLVQDLITPHGARFALYLPTDYRPGDPLVVSLHGTKVNNDPRTYLYEMGPYTLYNNGGFDWGGPTWPELANDREHYPAFAVISPQLTFAGDLPENHTLCVQSDDEHKVLGIIDYLTSQGVASAAAPKFITGHSSGGSLATAIEFRHPEIFSQAVIRHSSLENIIDLKTGQVLVTPVYNYNDTVDNCTYAYDSNGSCQLVPGSCVGVHRWQQSEVANNYMLFTNGDIDSTYHADTIASIAAFQREHQPLPKVRWLEWFSPDPHVNPFSCDSNLAGGVERRACHDESRDVAANFFFADKTIPGDLDSDGDRDCRDYRAQLQTPRDVNRDGVVNDGDTRFFYNNVTVDGNQMWQGGGNQVTLANAWPCSRN